MKRLLLVLVLILAACDSGPVSGTVVGSRFDPASDTIVTIPHTTCVGNPPICTTYFTFIPVHTPDRWYVTISDEKTEHHERQVTEATFKEARVGDQMTLQ